MGRETYFGDGVRLTGVLSPQYVPEADMPDIKADGAMGISVLSKQSVLFKNRALNRVHS